MEKPDEKGYVYVKWPSDRIPHGGIFHAKVANPSTEQQSFLKVLLEESKLTIAQRKKDEYTLRQEVKKIVPQRKEIPMIRPHTSRRRSLSAIRESGIFEIDQYRPLKRGEDREKLKENLAHQMAYGDEAIQPQVAPPPLKKGEIKLPTKKEQWNELVTQIRERADWLSEMEILGQGEPHRDLVKNQIAERMRALDALGIDSQCCTPRSIVSSARNKELSPQNKEHSARSRISVASKNSCQTFSTSHDKPKLSNRSSSQSHSTSHDKPKLSNRSSSQSYSTSHDKPKLSNRSSRSVKKEEDVSQYIKITPLQYSARRRV